MALSLLQHLRDVRRSALIQRISKHMQSEQAEQLVDLSLPLVLAHLVNINREHGTSLVIALLNTKAEDGLWKTLDHQQMIRQLSQTIGIDASQATSASNHIAHETLVEVHDLYETASLGEEGLNELLSEQPIMLQGHAPDWVFDVAGLHDVSGQQAVVPADPEELKIESGIAELNALIKEAAHEHHAPVDTHHAPVEIAPQREAGPFARFLMPLIALLILVALVVMYQNNHQASQNGQLVAPQGEMQGAQAAGKDNSQQEAMLSEGEITPDPVEPLGNPNRPDPNAEPFADQMTNIPLPPEAMPDLPTGTSETAEPKAVTF
jgi:hypothetical protein